MIGESSGGGGWRWISGRAGRIGIQGKDREDAVMSLVGWREGGGRRGVVNPGILAGITTLRGRGSRFLISWVPAW